MNIDANVNSIFYIIKVKKFDFSRSKICLVRKEYVLIYYNDLKS